MKELMFVLFGAALCLRGQPTALAPVPKELLNGTTLTVLESNFSIDSPGRDWAWFTAPSPAPSHLYVCQQASKDSSLVVVVVDVPIPRLDEGSMEKFMQGMKKSMVAKGQTVSDLQYQPSSLPLPGSYRFWGTVSSSDGSTAHWLGYVFAAGRAYAFQTFSREPVEPVAFTSMVASFQLLRQAPSPPLPGFGLLYFAQLAVVLGIAAAVNHFSRRPRLNGGQVAFVLIGLQAFALFVMVAIRLIGTDLEPEKAGERLGGVVGEALIPLIVALLLRNRFAKQKRAWEVAAQANKEQPAPFG